jgi:hypothetical protein
MGDALLPSPCASEISPRRSCRGGNEDPSLSDRSVHLTRNECSPARFSISVQWFQTPHLRLTVGLDA